MRLSNSINLVNLSFGSLLTALSLALPAFSQQDYDPNLKHFYMGRQQVTIENDSPIVNDKTGGSAGSGMNGALPGRPVPLPKAGWQPYAPAETPGFNPNLPKVPGPVRQNHNASANAPAAYKSRAGNLRAGSHGKTSPRSAIRGYKPYTTYPAQMVNPQDAADLGASTHVKGSVLHWAHQVHKEQ